MLNLTRLVIILTEIYILDMSNCTLNICNVCQKYMELDAKYNDPSENEFTAYMCLVLCFQL
jgi:hypothetical protein